MKISYRWLKEWVDIPWPVEETAERLTLLGFPVDDIVHTGLTVKNVIAVKILGIDKHPNADRLRIAQVTDGTMERTIVCGAPNIAVNQVVPLALPGAKLAGGLVIDVSKIRGVESAGMLCSERELGISASHEGIMMLPEDAKLGREVKDILGGDDQILTIDITPNRPDCLSHVGIAREISAVTGKPLKSHKSGWKLNSKGTPCKITIQDPKLCHRYLGKIFENVKIGPSPRWMADRLNACGIRPINNIVDITNFVLLEWGHPLHAFDLDKLAGPEIIIRRAKAGETIVALDGETYNLLENDLIIADTQKPVAIAGVMGGEHSGINGQTVRLLLESAVFDRVSIRNTSRRLNLMSESSYRFERGTDGLTAEMASLRAAQLIMELAAGTPGNAKDAYPRKLKLSTVNLRSSKLNLIAGFDIPPAKAEKALKNLNFKPKPSKGGWACVVPTHRPDVREEFDLIEEVIRWVGYDQIPATLPSLAPGVLPVNQRPVDTQKLAELLKGAGLNETLTNAFCSPKTADHFHVRPESRLSIRNPLSAEDSLLRPLLSMNLLQAVTKNIHFQRTAVHMFEIGKRYAKTGGSFEEKLCCGLVLYGPLVDNSWNSKPEAADFFTLKGLMEKIQLIFPSLTLDIDSEKPAFLHPHQSFVVRESNDVIGWGGMLHPSLIAPFDLKEACAVCEWEIKPTQAAHHPTFKAFPKFPFVERDVAIVVDKSVLWRDIEQASRRAGGTILEAIWPFDVFTSDNLTGDKKSVAFRIRLRHHEHTLSDAEITQAVEAIKSALAGHCGAQLR